VPWPQAVAGVVRPARVPTTPRWLVPAPPLLIQGGEFCRALMSLSLVTKERSCDYLCLWSPKDWMRQTRPRYATT